MWSKVSNVSSSHIYIAVILHVSSKDTEKKHN